MIHFENLTLSSDSTIKLKSGLFSAVSYQHLLIKRDNR